MSELIASLKKCHVSGNTVFLPDENLSNYPAVRKALLNAGAKYNRNKFVFPNDAQPFMDRLIGGNSVNIKKEFQFFPTPPNIADWLVEIACPDEATVILEPSAGQGAICQAIHKAVPGMERITCVELMAENRKVLEKIPYVRLLAEPDFLKLTPEKTGLFDVVIANPPFSKNQDLDHFEHMYRFVQPGGSVISVMSNHWRLGGNKREESFRKWIKGMNHEIHEIDPGNFKSSGTMIACCILVMDKPK